MQPWMGTRGNTIPHNSLSPPNSPYSIKLALADIVSQTSLRTCKHHKNIWREEEGGVSLLFWIGVEDIPDVKCQISYLRKNGDARHLRNDVRPHDKARIYQKSLSTPPVSLSQTPTLNVIEYVSTTEIGWQWKWEESQFFYCSYAFAAAQFPPAAEDAAVPTLPRSAAVMASTAKEGTGPIAALLAATAVQVILTKCVNQ